MTLSIDTEQPQEKPSTTMEEILAALAVTPMTEREIRQVVGGNTSNAAQVLRELVAQGQLLRTGNGRKGSPFVYTLSGAVTNLL